MASLIDSLINIMNDENRQYTELDILIAFDIFNGSSSINTMSAASIAASLPNAPIAIPISALESTGASLIPSPTNVLTAPQP